MFRIEGEKTYSPVETFSEFLRRHTNPGLRHSLPEGVLAWPSIFRGRGQRNRIRNEMKRAIRASHRIDRAAHIRYERALGNTAHVPKLKAVPAYVFE